MTFDKWSKDKDHWKPETLKAFEALWVILDGAGLETEDVAEMLDRVIDAMTSEFCG